MLGDTIAGFLNPALLSRHIDIGKSRRGARMRGPNGESAIMSKHTAIDESFH